MPVAIGGVGGSGTRVVAGLVRSLGFAMGRDLNGPNDNLAYTLLFKHPDVPALSPEAFTARARLFVAAMTGKRPPTSRERALVAELAAEDRPQHDRRWLQQRAKALLASGEPLADRRRWGWKEPNTHIALPQWRQVLPRLRYIHVVRNGLDMAFSGNQNQRELWGRLLLGRDPERTPAGSLAYWCAAHRRVAEIGATLGDDFLWLDFDALCRDPDPGLRRLADFLGAPHGQLLAHRDDIEPPASIGRSRDVDLAPFAPADLDYLRSIGHLS